MPDLTITDWHGDMLLFDGEDRHVRTSYDYTDRASGPWVQLHKEDADKIVAWFQEQFPGERRATRFRARLGAAGEHLTQMYGELRAAVRVLVKGFDNA